MTEPHRVLIEFDHQADGIWWVSPKEEQEAATHEEWRRACEALYGPSGQPPPLRELLSSQLLDDLKAWNDAHDYTIVAEDEGILDDDQLQEQGRELAIRVQNELGTQGWEVLYYRCGRYHRVHPPGSWPWDIWEQDLLGYAPRRRSVLSEEDARIIEGLREEEPQAGTDDPDPAES